MPTIHRLAQVCACLVVLFAYRMTNAADTAAAAPTTPTDQLEEFLRREGIEASPPAIAAPQPLAQAGRLKLMDISLDILAATGWSTERGASLLDLQAGGHDPRARGFTLQNVELSFQGAVDPYFSAEAHLITLLDPAGETVFELEEAFAITQALPAGLALKAGQFFTEFGRLNPQHPHAWHWIDQPIVLSRFFGSDGMRAPGLRASWLTPLPWTSELMLGAQNAVGETMASFLASDELYEERPVVRRPFVARDVASPADLVYLMRWVNGGEVRETLALQWGMSALSGPNATGPHAMTRIFGTDLVMKWRPANSFRGWPFVSWESEALVRRFRAAAFSGDRENSLPSFPAETMIDAGGYSQLLYGFSYRWASGIRYEWASAKRPKDETDPFRNRRTRLSPLLTFMPSEYSRLRLQYNYDRAAQLTNGAHSVWLGFEWLFGAHPAHTF